MYIKQVCDRQLLRLGQVCPGKVRKSLSFTLPKYGKMYESSPSPLSGSYHLTEGGNLGKQEPFSQRPTIELLQGSLLRVPHPGPTRLSQDMGDVVGDNKY